MFEEQSSADKKVEDIFSATDQAGAAPPLGPPSALSQGKLQPVGAGARSSLPADQLSALPKVGFPFKKALAIGIVSLVVMGGAGVSWFWWQKRGTSQPPPESGRPREESGSAQPSEPAPGVFESVQERAINRALNPLDSEGAPAGAGGEAATGAETPTPGADTDSDGLSDGDELQLGTNLRLVDTDGDGLSDWEEAKIFTTNPLVADTDGDTYADGVEVQNGFNPKGAGKLLDFQQAKENINQ